MSGSPIETVLSILPRRPFWPGISPTGFGAAVANGCEKAEGVGLLLVAAALLPPPKSISAKVIVAGAAADLGVGGVGN